MSLLAPLFLAAIGAVTLPILFHLIRRTPRGRVEFSSLLFLSPSPPRVTRRSRLEHWLLLLLRAMALVLIALAFARPFLWEQATTGMDASGPAKRLAILLDTSASMQRVGLWASAVKQVDEAVHAAGPADQIALFTFDRRPRALVTLQQWNSTAPAQRVALIEQALRETKPGWADTRLGDALIATAESLNELESNDNVIDASAVSKPSRPRPEQATFTGPREILLISDLQSGSDLKSLDAYHWPAEVTLRLSPLAASRQSNAGVQLVTDRDAASDQRDTIRVRITNSRDSQKEQFHIRFVADKPAQPAPSATPAAPVESTFDAYVPPGETRVFVAPPSVEHWQGNHIALEGDDITFDNRAYRITPTPRQTTVLFIGGDDPTDPKGLLYYLNRSFAPTRQLRAKVTAVKPDQPLPAAELLAASLLVVADDVPAARRADLRKLAEAGATVLCIARDNTIAATLNELLQSDSVTISEASVAEYAMLGEIDFKHPLFAPFADPRFGDFTKIRFWKHRVIDLTKLDAAVKPHVLAKFDDGSPGLTELATGKGRVLALGAGWHPVDGQLALSSKFVPLLHVLLHQSLGVPPKAPRWQVGDAVDLSWLPPTERGQALTVKRPDGATVAVNPGETFNDADMPGVYSITTASDTYAFAVNLAPNESDTAALSADELEKRGVKLWQSTDHLQEAFAQRQRQLQMRELESRHKIWRWLLVGAIAVLAVETFVAGRFTRKAATDNQDVDHG